MFISICCFCNSSSSFLSSSLTSTGDKVNSSCLLGVVKNVLVLLLLSLFSCIDDSSCDVTDNNDSCKANSNNASSSANSTPNSSLNWRTNAAELLRLSLFSCFEFFFFFF